MYRNYENRVKDFILDMTNPRSKIQHKDITEKITNTRLETMNELFKKNPEKKKPLVFRGYISEADRIKDTIKNNKYLYYLPDYEKIKKDKKKLKLSSSPNKKNLTKLKSFYIEKNKINNKNKILNKNYSLSTTNDNKNKKKDLLNNLDTGIFQPTMRYTARTDLERVYDVLNGYHYDEKSKDIIERQLKSINLYDFKKQNGILEKDDANINTKKKNISKSLISKTINNHKRKKKLFDLYKKNDIYYNPKNDIYKPWHRREDLNNEAYGLLSSYHYKTHFKAAEEIAESNYKYDKNNNNNNSVFLLPNLLPNFYKPKKNIKADNGSEVKEDSDPFKFGEDDDNSSDQSEDYEEFDKNYNPVFKKSKTTSDPETMKLLTKIAFKQKRGINHFDFKNDYDEENKEIKKIKNQKRNNNYTEDNNVIINNKLYYKNSQFDKITNEILELCNVYSTKSKYNNTVHKSKGGKTMITRGMTVGEFEKKYRLQE